MKGRWCSRRKSRAGERSRRLPTGLRLRKTGATGRARKRCLPVACRGKAWNRQWRQIQSHRLIPGTYGKSKRFTPSSFRRLSSRGGPHGRRLGGVVALGADQLVPHGAHFEERLGLFVQPLAIVAVAHRLLQNAEDCLGAEIILVVEV